jgi:hypothetical protein
MKRFLILVLFVQCLFVRSGQASLSPEQALSAAAQIWGSSGFARHVGRNYQVGCVVNGETIVVSSSKDSFDDALSHVNMQSNGLHVLTVTAFGDAGETVTSVPVPVFACNR